MRIRDLGYTPGWLKPGPKNSILDVKGVHVGQITIEEGGDVRKGVTVILPRDADDVVDIPCYAGMHCLNGNGQVTGSFQIKDWGFINTPIALTNSTSLGLVYDALWRWVLSQHKAKGKTIYQIGRDYGTPIVGETADWWLNDVFRSAIAPADIDKAIENASTQESVQEGQHGGGAGMTCHEFTGGTGTASRVVDGEDGKEYTVGVLVQSNYGHRENFHIGGLPIGRMLAKETESKEKQAPGGKVDEGSIVIIIFTDAPMLPHQLNRLAQRATVGLAQVGGHGIGRNSSGDIFLAVSTGNALCEQLSAPKPTPGQSVHSQPAHRHPCVQTTTVQTIKNESVDAVFRAASEATEEAILNSLVGGREGRVGFRMALEGLPVDKVAELLKKHLVVV
ncbi:MAG: hypothetical protein M1834_008517 [Cirrosporium novae-zelandiae]|nr:MAG: hypothetical protein M1834_008517 [Cirrosporium novae-zelandiae]